MSGLGASKGANLVKERFFRDTLYIQKKTNLCNPKILFIVFDLENLYPSLRLILCQPLGVPQFSNHL